MQLKYSIYVKGFSHTFSLKPQFLFNKKKDLTGSFRKILSQYMKDLFEFNLLLWDINTYSLYLNILIPHFEKKPQY